MAQSGLQPAPIRNKGCPSPWRFPPIRCPVVPSEDQKLLKISDVVEIFSSIASDVTCPYFKIFIRIISVDFLGELNVCMHSNIFSTTIFSIFQLLTSSLDPSVGATSSDVPLWLIGFKAIHDSCLSPASQGHYLLYLGEEKSLLSTAVQRPPLTGQFCPCFYSGLGSLGRFQLFIGILIFLTF